MLVCYNTEVLNLNLVYPKYKRVLLCCPLRKGESKVMLRNKILTQHRGFLNLKFAWVV